MFCVTTTFFGFSKAVFVLFVRAREGEGEGGKERSQMDDIDDLLGGPATTAVVAGNNADANLMDDLLGGPEPSTQLAAFDDDLLGPGISATSPEAITPSATMAPPPEAAVASKKMPKPVKLELQPLTDVPVGLRQFCSSATYHVQHITLIDKSRSALRKILTCTDSHVLVYNDDLSVDRSVEITDVAGMISQKLRVKNRFGFGGDEELHVCIQVINQRDIFFSMSEADATESPRNLAVLSSLCLSHGIAIPVVRDLRNGEDIFAMVKWGNEEDRLRLQLCEALAFRNALSVELKALSQEEMKCDSSIESLRHASGNQAVIDIRNEISTIEASIFELSDRMQALEEKMVSAQNFRAELQRQLDAEEAKRAEKAKETIQLQSKVSFMRQVAEFEIAKRAHKRDMDRINCITSINERRLTNRKLDTYGPAEIALRIDGLEDESLFITEKLIEVAELYSAKQKVLSEAKKRLAEAKLALARLDEEISIVSTTPHDAELPDKVSLDLAPIFEAVGNGRINPLNRNLMAAAVLARTDSSITSTGKKLVHNVLRS